MALQRSSSIIGKVVDGYQIEEVLGRGGMGIVYKAVDTSLDRVVALKVMNPLLVDNEQIFRRFKVEAKALGRLAHPNIVGVFTLRHTEDYLFIVMEYVDGGTLTDLIHQHEKIPWHNAIPIIEQTLSAVEYAHKQHVIHRDIKPSNILISSSGIAQVTDFGLAKIQNLSADTRGLTKTGITGGTLYYMPPEQLAGLAKVDHRGDIYSLGMTYYVMLAGQSPFDKLSSEFEILKAIDAHDFPSLDKANKDIPEALVRIVMKAVEREPEDRYQSAGEMLEALQAWLAPSSSEASAWSASHTLTPSPTRSPSRHRRGKRQRDTSSLLKKIKTFLTKARSKTSSHGTRFRESPRQEPALPLPAPVQTGSTLPRAQVKPQPDVDAPTQVSSPVAEPIVGDKPLTRLPEEPQPDIGATPQGTPPLARDDLDKTIIVSGEEPHTARLLWKRPVFGAFLVAAVLLAVLSFALFRTLFDSPSEKSSGPVANALANLSIRTVPEEVNVYLNEEQVGSTPLMGYTTTAGTMALHLEKDGYVPLDTSVTVEANDTLAFDFVLHPQREDTEVSESDEPPAIIPSLPEIDVAEAQQGIGEIEGSVAAVPADPQQNDTATPGPLTGTLRIVVRPFGDIYIDNVQKASGTSKVYQEERPAGVYKVRATHPQLGRWEKSIEIRAGEEQEVLFNFNQMFKVGVMSEPSNAQIIVDKIPQNRNTPTQISLPPGQHTIAVRLKDHVMEGAARTITLESNIKETLRFILRKEQ